MEKSYEKILNQALLSRNKEKIQNAYEIIYYDFVKLVAFVIAKYVDDQDMVKDITNDTFLAFFNNSERVENIKAYLVVTAKNKALKYLEKNTDIDIDSVQSLFIATNSHVKSNIYYKEILADLRRTLSEDEVDIILLHVIEGFTFKEIGKSYNKNENTIKTIYNRAINKYRIYGELI